MRREWADQGVILRIGHFRDNDLWLKLLFRTKGMVTAFAFGASRSRRRFCGCLDVFNTIQCRVITSGRGDFLNLQEATLLSGPQVLRKNWQRMGMATNCLRFLEAIGVSVENAGETFCLLEDVRQTMEGAASVSALFPLFFRLRVACMQGYAPGLENCYLCGAPPKVGEQSFFQVDEGQCVCAACRDPSAGRSRYQVLLPYGALTYLNAVAHASPSAWPPVPESGGDRRACVRAIDGFIQYHLGLVWENGYFRRA